MAPRGARYIQMSFYGCVINMLEITPRGDRAGLMTTSNLYNDILFGTERV